MTPEAIVHAVLTGDSPDHAVLDALPEDDWDATIERLLVDPTGRRWLRTAPQLGHVWPREKVHHRLLSYEEDFRTKRRDVSLTVLLDCASDDELLCHACAIVVGPAGTSFWERWEDDPDEMLRIAVDTIQRCDAAAAEAIVYQFVVDPLDTYRLGSDRRTQIAIAALASSGPEVRGLAAEYLHDSAPSELLADFDRLVRDESERVRGIVWTAALRLARADARDLAFGIIGDESEPLENRRSALVAVGTLLPTSDLAELLSFLVVHPTVELATDAAALLFDRHRHPDIAMAAQRSPHERVREIAEALLDPFRGSPAAGGSRPGDPTRANTADIYRDAIRQFEERAGETDREP